MRVGDLLAKPVFIVGVKYARLAGYVSYAGLAELVDATHSKCVVERRAGSSPASGTVSQRWYLRITGEQK